VKDAIAEYQLKLWLGVRDSTLEYVKGYAKDAILNTQDMLIGMSIVR
jgi:hypothetical protein